VDTTSLLKCLPIFMQRRPRKVLVGANARYVSGPRTGLCGRVQDSGKRRADPGIVCCERMKKRMEIPVEVARSSRVRRHLVVWNPCGRDHLSPPSNKIGWQGCTCTGAIRRPRKNWLGASHPTVQVRELWRALLRTGQEASNTRSHRSDVGGQIVCNELGQRSLVVR
jgi:hypothetical protein